MPSKPGFDAWQSGFHVLLERRSENLWEIADSYNQGLDWFGEDASQAVEPRLISESRLQTIAGVGRKFSGPNKDYRLPPEVLSFSHHEAVRTLIGDWDHPEWETDAWAILATAVLEDWSVSTVEEEVRKVKGEDLESDFLRSPVQMLADLYNELMAVTHALPPSWSEERALLGLAEKHLVDALHSARNRSVGTPAEVAFAEALSKRSAPLTADEKKAALD